MKHTNPRSGGMIGLATSILLMVPLFTGGAIVDVSSSRAGILTHPKQQNQNKNRGGTDSNLMLHSSSSALSLFSGDFLYYTNKTHDTVAAGGDDTDTNTGGGTGEGLFEEIEDGGIIGVSPILLLLHMLLAAYLSPPI